MQALSCQEFVELVTDYFEGALGEADRARFEAHLEECPPCRIHLAQMRQTLRVVAATRELERRPEVAALLAAFRDFRRERQDSR